jgi:hypothetical protein
MRAKQPHRNNPTIELGIDHEISHQNYRLLFLETPNYRLLFICSQVGVGQVIMQTVQVKYMMHKLHRRTNGARNRSETRRRKQETKDRRGGEGRGWGMGLGVPGGEAAATTAAAATRNEKKAVVNFIF